MGNILVVLPVEGKGLGKANLCAITAAKQLQTTWSKTQIVALAIGVKASDAAQEAATHGFSKVYHLEQERYLAAPFSAATLKIFNDEGCSAAVCVASTTGKDLMPKIAATLEAGQASDIIGVNEDGTVKRLMYAGDIIADVEVLTENKVVTARATAFEPSIAQGSAAPVVELGAVESDSSASFVSFEGSSSERPQLGDADVVISGGRALKSAQNFETVIAPLADALGGAIGASRAAVDSGYAPNDWQVGQTGKIVAPDLYIAVGISGAIQHIAGMKDSKVIVAINSDADAPIFEIADYGLVADLYEAVPELTEKVKNLKS